MEPEGLPPLDSFPKLGFCKVCYKPQYETPNGASCENGHGGVETIDEIPTCLECKHPLKPDAKFCDECGASTEPKEEESKTLCPECKSEVEDGVKFCGECGCKMGTDAKVEKPKVTIPKKTEETKKTVELPKDEPEEEIDLSNIDPSKEWECFGQIEADHIECKGCQFREKCAEKSGIKL